VDNKRDGHLHSLDKFHKISGSLDEARTLRSHLLLLCWLCCRVLLVKNAGPASSWGKDSPKEPRTPDWRVGNSTCIRYPVPHGPHGDWAVPRLGSPVSLTGFKIFNTGIGINCSSGHDLFKTGGPLKRLNKPTCLSAADLL
jgi:hypothetical protein